MFFFFFFITTSRFFGSYLILKFKTLYNSSYLFFFFFFFFERNIIPPISWCLIPPISLSILCKICILDPHWPETELKQASQWSAGERITALLIHNQTTFHLNLQTKKKKKTSTAVTRLMHHMPRFPPPLTKIPSNLTDTPFPFSFYRKTPRTL